MKNSYKMIIISVFIIIILIISGSVIYQNYREAVTISPEVKITNETYNVTGIIETFWTPSIYDDFEEEYASRYSDKLRDKIVDNMKEQASALGENPDILEYCLQATGRLNKSGLQILPCLAEKAKFEYYSNYRGIEPYTTGCDWIDELEDINTTTAGPRVSEECWIFTMNWGVKEFENLGHIKIYAVSIEDYTILYYNTCG